MKLYEQHHGYVPKLTRSEISAQLDAKSYAPVGRKYLNSNILNKMADLEELGAEISNISINSTSHSISSHHFICLKNLGNRALEN